MAARNALFPGSVRGVAETVPFAVFTQLELAQVRLTEDHAAELANELSAAIPGGVELHGPASTRHVYPTIAFGIQQMAAKLRLHEGGAVAQTLMTRFRRRASAAEDPHKRASTGIAVPEPLSTNRVPRTLAGRLGAVQAGAHEQQRGGPLEMVIWLLTAGLAAIMAAPAWMSWSVAAEVFQPQAANAQGGVR